MLRGNQQIFYGDQDKRGKRAFPFCVQHC